MNKMKFVGNTVFYDVMPYGLVDSYHCCTGTCCIHLEVRRDSCTQKIVKDYSFKPENLSTKLYITSEKTITLKYSKLCYTNILKSSLIHATLVYEKHIILQNATVYYIIKYVQFDRIYKTTVSQIVCNHLKWKCFTSLLGLLLTYLQSGLKYLYQYVPSGGGVVIFLLNSKICGSEKEICVLIKQFIILIQNL